MSQNSDERLVIDAVKGDSQAIELLQARVKSYIRLAFERGVRYRDARMIRVLEAQVVEKVLNSLHTYSFQQPVQVWVSRIACNMAQLHNRSGQVEKGLPKERPKLSHTTPQAKPPPLEGIDSEIRSLVGLLNQSSDIQTISSCSGHPAQEKWITRQWNTHGGWISMKPKGDPRKALDFLVALLARLDNTAVMKMENDGAHQDDAIRQRYKRVKAESLFHSGIPIVIVDVSLELFARHQELSHRLEIWKQLIASIGGLITEDTELISEVEASPDKAVEYLKEALQRLPFIFSVQLSTNCYGYHKLQFRAKVDYFLCQWFSDLANRMYAVLGKAGHLDTDTEGEAQFVAEWKFILQPLLNAESIPLPHITTTHWNPRTRADHLKIWELIELAVAEQIE